MMIPEWMTVQIVRFADGLPTLLIARGTMPNAGPFRFSLPLSPEESDPRIFPAARLSVLVEKFAGLCLYRLERDPAKPNPPEPPR